jgi:excinuclease ABC subunit A
MPPGLLTARGDGTILRRARCWRELAAAITALAARVVPADALSRGVRVCGEPCNVLDDKPIHEITALSVAESRRFLAGLPAAIRAHPAAVPLIAEIGKRLEFLEKVGLAYLTLDRAADTLSGGELQRVRLATSIGSGLVGVCYVLDEPSIGLHSRDNQRLIEALRDLQSQGNTVLVVEHDEAFMRNADMLIDMGPGAPTRGGAIVAQGTLSDVAAHADSITGRYLSKAAQIQIPATRRRTAKSRSLYLEGAATNNLKHVSVRFPRAPCATGASGKVAGQ